MIEKGKVIKVFDGLAEILLETGEFCNKCSHCSANSNTVKKVIAKNNLSAKIGDKVKVFVNENILFASFLFYFIPLVSLLFFMFLGSKLKLNDLEVFLLGIGGMLFSYFIIRCIGKYIKVKNYIMEIIK